MSSKYSYMKICMMSIQHMWIQPQHTLTTLTHTTHTHTQSHHLFVTDSCPLSNSLSTVLTSEVHTHTHTNTHIHMLIVWFTVNIKTWPARKLMPNSCSQILKPFSPPLFSTNITNPMLISCMSCILKDADNPKAACWICQQCSRTERQRQKQQQR